MSKKEEVTEALIVQENDLLPTMVMGIDAMKAMHNEKMAFIKDVMVDGHDYGKIPGCGDKPTLLKPGAEKLLQVYGLGSKMERVSETSMEEVKRYEVCYKCSVFRKNTGMVVAECEGSVCSEEKVFWQKSPQRMKNTMRKMAQKRAFVGAALFATGCSDVFTQDIEDMTEDTHTTQRTPSPTPAPQPSNPKVIELQNKIADIVKENNIAVDRVKEIILAVTNDPKAKLRNVQAEFLLELILTDVINLTKGE